MGLRGVVLTNAAGGINREYKQGALVVIRDHINLQGQNPLIGRERRAVWRRGFRT